MAGIHAAQWEHDVMKQAFACKLYAEDAGAGELLSSLATELQEENGGQQALLTFSVADRVLVERLSMPLKSRMQYLLSALEQLQVAKTSPELAERVWEAESVVISYVMLLLQVPDMFGADALAPAPVLVSFLTHHHCAGALLKAIERRYVRDAGDDLTEAEEALAPLLAAIVDRAPRACVMDNSASLLLSLWSSVLENDGVGRVVLGMDAWLPEGGVLEDGRAIQRTVLGAVFTPHAADDRRVWNEHFPDPSVLQGPREQYKVISTVATMQSSYTDELKAFTERLLRRSRAHLDRTLAWMAAACNANLDRVKVQYDAETTATDGFFYNLASVLLQLAGPFVEDTSRAHYIESRYLLFSKRIDWSNETHLVATDEDIAYWVDKRNADRQAAWKQRMNEEGKISVEPVEELAADHRYNFITECFFLCMRALQLGVLQIVMAKRDKLARNIRDLEKWLEDKKDLVDNPVLQPFQRAQVRAQVAEITQRLTEARQQQLAYECVIFHKATLEAALKFYNIMAWWLLSVASPPAHGLPLPEKVPMLWASLPEGPIGNMLRMIPLALQSFPDLASTINLDCVLTVAITMLNSPRYINNPYLRSRAGALVHELAPANGEEDNQVTAFQLMMEDNPFAAKHLLPGMIQLFVDMEVTGSHTQFFDKFNTRYRIAIVLKWLWPQERYRASVDGIAHTELFAKFLSMLFDDFNFLLDDSIDHLKKMLDVKLKIAAGEYEDQAQLRDMHKTVRQWENLVRSWMPLAKETTHLLQYMSAHFAEVFLQGEYARRSATMLNNFLCVLVKDAPKFKQLDLGKMNFDPRFFLGEIVRTYTHLEGRPSFLREIADDKRSYSKALFDQVTRIVTTYPILRQVELEKWVRLCKQVEQEESNLEALEDQLGDVPDEYLDALTFELMKDPVQLPHSKCFLDRPTIKRHLLSDPSDPFDRSPLTVEDLVECPELKAKIAAFVLEKTGRTLA